MQESRQSSITLIKDANLVLNDELSSSVKESNVSNIKRRLVNAKAQDAYFEKKAC